jgi:hypothetical protein
MIFQLYYHSGAYLNPVGTYVGDPRYLGMDGGSGDGQAAWNYWVRATENLGTACTGSALAKHRRNTSSIMETGGCIGAAERILP